MDIMFNDYIYAIMTIFTYIYIYIKLKIKIY